MFSSKVKNYYHASTLEGKSSDEIYDSYTGYITRNPAFADDMDIILSGVIQMEFEIARKRHQTAVYLTSSAKAVVLPVLAAGISLSYLFIRPLVVAISCMLIISLVVLLAVTRWLSDLGLKHRIDKLKQWRAAAWKAYLKKVVLEEEEGDKPIDNE